MDEQDDDLLELNAPADDDAVEQVADTDAADDAGDAEESDIPEGYIPPGVLAKIRGGYKTQLSKKDAALKELQDKLARFEQPQQQAPQYQQEISPEDMVRSQQLDTFEEMARMQVGDEVVDEAQKWFQEISRSRPGVAREIQSSRNPYKALLTEFHDHLLREEIAELQAEHGFDPADPDGWAVQRYRTLAQERAGSQQQSSQQPPPPRSIVNQPSTGGGVNGIRTGPGAAFDDAF